MEVNRAIEILKSNVNVVALGDKLPEHALANNNLELSLELKGEYEAGNRHDA